MKRLILYLLIFSCSVDSYGQKIYENYTKTNDSLRIGKGEKDFLQFNDKGYTLVLPDTTTSISGMIISLEDEKFDLKNNPKQQIYKEAILKNLAVLYVSTGIPVDFYFSDKSLSFIDTTILGVFAKYSIPNRNIFFLGVSLSGHRALKYIEYCKTGKSKFKPEVKGVVLCDGVLDWVRQWYEERKAVKDNFAPSSVWSGKLVTYLFEKNLKGTPKDNLNAYLDFSPYSYFDEENRHLKYFKDLAIRAYTEPATYYWMDERRKGVFDTNFPDMVGIINELKLLGNDRGELIVFNQDKENKDRRNPYYTWTLVDKTELINWMIGMTR